MRTRCFALYAALGFGIVALATPAWGATPTAELRGTVDRVLAILNEPAPDGLEAAARRDAEVREAIEARFDFDETARQALGLYWRDRRPEERRQFTGLFTELLERTYIRRIGGHRGTRVTYLGESVHGDDAYVRTSIVTPRGTAIPVEYRLLRRHDQWLVTTCSSRA